MARLLVLVVFFFNDTATTEIYTLSLHDALPILSPCSRAVATGTAVGTKPQWCPTRVPLPIGLPAKLPHLWRRSEEHTSELQSRQYLVCRLLLEKKKKTSTQTRVHRCETSLLDNR